MKRIIAILLALCMLLSLLPAASAAPQAPSAKAKILTEADYAAADLVWSAVNQKEAELLTKRATPKQTTDALIAVVEASENYVEGSLIRKGDFFTWQTDEGITCGYSPALSEKARNAKTLEGFDPETAQTVETVSYETKGGYPGKKNVYVIQPYYGIDSSFTTQYKNEGQSIAKALGGTSTTYITTSATIDNIANALEDGAVVMFDSHGDTDYAKGTDYTSKANTSYICLQSGAGLTTADYAVVEGPYDSYSHAYYYGANGNMKYYCVDGTAIANHMEKNSSNSLLWMAICLGMATDGMNAPLRKKGVEVVYGYSQSVTFDYDYSWEEVFWDEMINGATVAEAVATMKDEVGLWDWCHDSESDTISEARATDCAFPIVVSSEDNYPGHGNVDDLQTVKSTWMLYTDCGHSSVQTVKANAPTCTEAGNIAYYLCNSCGGYFSDAACTKQISHASTVLPATGHSFDEGILTSAPSCTEEGTTTYTCKVCGTKKTEAVLPLGHSYENGTCTVCGQGQPIAVPFQPGVSGEYVIAANVSGTYYAMSNSFPTSSSKLSGSEIKVTDGYVLAEDAAGYQITLTYDSSTDSYTIESNGSYLYYPSGTNLGSSGTPYAWSIETGTNGSWRILSQTASRALIYRAKSYNTFGGYHAPNASAGSGEYFDLEILAIGIPSGDATPSCTHENKTENTTAATCEANGTLTVSCTDCGELLSTSTTPALGHNWDDGKVTAEATCTDSGKMTYSCMSCEKTKTEDIAALGHNYENGICTNCGNTVPAATGFSIGQGGEYVIAALVNGSYYAMSNAFPSSGKIEGTPITVTNGCVAAEDAENLAVTLSYQEADGCYTIYNGSSYLSYPGSGTNLASKTDAYTWNISTGTNGSWRVLSETAKRALVFRAGGYNQFGGYSTTNISAGGADYYDVEILPIGSSASTEPSLDENIVINHSLNLASDISINYVVKSALLSDYDSYYLECILPDYNGNSLVGNSTVTVEPVLNGSYYYFTLNGMTAVRMGDVVEAKLHMTKDGKSYVSPVDSYSVSSYAYAQLNKDTSSEALKKLCADLLRYGALAQTFKSYRTDALADAAMTETQKGYLSDLEAVSFSSNNTTLDDLTSPVITWAGKTLSLESKVILKFVINTSNYTGNLEDLRLHVSFVNYKGETETAVLTELTEYMASQNLYAFDFDGLLAAELRSVVSVAVYEGDTQLSATVQYAADAYGNGKNGALLDLCKGLIAYSDTALAYFSTN